MSHGLRLPLAAMVLAALGCGGGAPAGAAGADLAVPDASAEAGSDAGGVDAGLPDAGVDAGTPDAAVSYPVPDWATATPAEVGLDAVALESAAAAASADESFCLLVIRHGKLVFERYFAGTTRWSTPPSWSIAKSYSSALVGIAIERGDLQGLDEPVADYVPSWRGTSRAAITLRHLVSMTSGLQWSAFDDYVTLSTFSPDNTQHAVSKAYDKAPGTGWTYDNGAVQVLEQVFRSATGDSIEAYAQAHLWSRLGMGATWKHDATGHPTTYANVLATCRDHARFGYLLLHHGRWANGEQVIPEAYLSQALAPSQSFNRAYGFLFWLNAETPAMDAMMEPWPGRPVPYAPADLFAARGFGNQVIDVIPSLDLIVVRFGADPMASFSLPVLMADAKFTRHDDFLRPILTGVTP